MAASFIWSRGDARAANLPRAAGVLARFRGCLGRFVAAIGVAAFGLTSTGPVAASPAQTPSRYAAVRTIIENELRKEGAPSVAVAVYREGRIDWEEGFGWADRDKKVKATADTIYSLASISKSFTGTALMAMAAKGEINLDRPVEDYLGGAKLNARVGAASDVTVRRVANHMAGLPLHVQFFYDNEAFRAPPPAETIGRYANIVRVPGTNFRYSNLGYGLLSRVIEVRSGKPYGDYMRDAVFKPLGLTRTAVNPTNAAFGANVAVSYNLDNTPIARFVTDHPGATEVFSSVHDLIRFAAFNLKAHRDDQRAILSDAQIDATHAAPNGKSGYALGYSVGERSGYKMVSHGGDMPGVATQMMIFPAEGVAIVVLANSMRHDMVARIADAVAASVLPNWKSRSGPTPSLLADKPFVPAPEIVGTWSGRIARPEGDLPMTLQVAADGALTAAIGAAPAVAVKGAQFAGGDLTGQATGSLGTRDAERYPYNPYFVLHLEGDRLYGTVTALGDVSPSNKHIVAALSYWTDLTRKP